MYTIYYFIYSFLFRCTDTLINITSIVSCIIVFSSQKKEPEGLKIHAYL